MENKWSEIEALTTSEELKSLKELHEFFNGPAIADWMAGLWCPTTGGFYYANSARDYEGFLPDIESTVQLLRWTVANGALASYGSYSNALPKTVKDKLLNFVLSLQDEASGYFYHPQWGSGIGGARRGRDLGWSVDLIKQLGGTPKYPTATERLAACAEGKGTSSNLPEYLTSREKYLAWLYEINASMRENSGGAHGMNAVCSQIVAAGFLDDTLEFLDNMQKTIYEEQIAAGETPTGLWQKPTDYKAVWGLLKLASFYGRGRTRSGKKYVMRYPREAVRTCVNVILLPATEGRYFMNDIYNQWSGLGTAINDVKCHSPEMVDELYSIVRERLPEMIGNSIEKLKPFKQADNTFSYRMGISSPTTQGVEVSLGYPEGDVNATCLASSMYRCVFTDIGLPVVPLCTAEDGERFIATVSRAKPIVKKPRPEK